VSPAPRKVTDDDVFAATQRAMARYGPQELTLAHIAAEAGVTAGRLVQRFGSKRLLLLALSNRFGSGGGEMFEAIRLASGSPLAALRAYAACMAGLAPTADALARNLAYLQIDLTDPDFRANLLANARETRRQLESLVRAAVSARELAETTPARQLARTIETVVSGALMTWACYQEGPAERWLAREVEAVLEPYLPPATPRQAPRARR
jgi:AcrR family transcriptional regulator